MDMEGGRLDNVGKLSSTVIANTSGDVNTVTAIALGDASVTLTAANMTGSRIFTITPTVARNLQVATATNIIEQLIGYEVGANFAFTVINTTTFDVTLATNTGVTLVGKMIVNNGSGTWRVRVDSATDVTIYTEAARDNKITIQVFTTSGTWTRPTGCVRIRVRVVGGGGGGRGGDTAGGVSPGGGGGGGGGYAEKLLTATASETITIGAGGAGSTALDGAVESGVTGGTTSFGSTVSATGGVGGFGGVANEPSPAGGDGGVGSGGNINIDGGGGTTGVNDSTGGTGGSSVLGGGGAGQPRGVVGLTGGNYGGGGGGGGGDVAGAHGGPGAAGVVIVEEFY